MYKDDGAYKAHFELLGRIMALETSVRALLLATDVAGEISAQIKRECRLIAEDLRSKHGVAGEASASGCEFGLGIILTDI
ncbi:hypothetical protein GGR77_001541 [Xanthomonas translucens]